MVCLIFLQEISGFAFNKGDVVIVYAQQDEDGLLFKMPIRNKDDQQKLSLPKKAIMKMLPS
jgi:hypothetical protein